MEGVWRSLGMDGRPIDLLPGSYGRLASRGKEPQRVHVLLGAKGNSQEVLVPMRSLRQL